MSQLPLFYLNDLGSEVNTELTGDTAHHIATVLRMRSGERVRLSDGHGKYSDATIEKVDKKSITICLDGIHIQQNLSPQLCVIQAIPKSDRLKETIELLVEVGVDEITPWQSERSIGKFPEDGAEKWQNAIRAASSQSRRVTIPTLTPVKKIEEIVALMSPSDRIFLCHESSAVKFSELLTSQPITPDIERIHLVIGPEGGISDQEIVKFSSLIQCSLISLGSTVFRSAHAGIAAFSALQMALGRW